MKIAVLELSMRDVFHMLHMHAAVDYQIADVVRSYANLQVNIFVAISQ